ncbi:MAG: rhodanese-like domain-containing protein [Planctomycetota bacterium]
MKEVNAAEAHELMNKEAYVYIDVRSEAEFMGGHPAGALNIPAFLPGPSGMAPNPDFVATVQGLFPTDAKLALGCQMGGRSARACQLLEKAGFKAVLNVRGGYGGTRDAFGRVVEKGWADLGLPVSRDNSDAVSHQGLKRKAHRA